MAEYIDKKALITEIQSAVSMVLQTAPYEKVWFDRFVDRQNEILAIIERQPTAEVIRCRNCIHDGLSTCPMCYIEDKTLVFVNHDPDFYCGNGEHKGGQAPQRED